MSAAKYQAIITAIDGAVEEGVSGPGEVTFADGRVIKYQSLAGLNATRKRYAALLVKSRGKTGIKMHGIKFSGGRS